MALLHFPRQKYDLIHDAIERQVPISAVYQGRRRLLCPHVLGEDAGGKHQGLFYQFGGESGSRPIAADGSPDNWRCLAIDKLTEIRVIGGQWHTAPNASRPQHCVKKIHVEV